MQQEFALTMCNNLLAADGVIVGINAIIVSMQHEDKRKIITRNNYLRVGVEKEDRDCGDVIAVVIEETTCSKTSVEKGS